MDFRAQASAIPQITRQYNVTYIGIDSTGVGTVFMKTLSFFPAAREFVYNPNVKNALVLKAYDIISHRRLEFDAGIPTSRSPLCPSAVQPPPAATGQPTKPAAQKKPATQIWPGQRCTAPV
jgi:hypothetical protein